MATGYSQAVIDAVQEAPAHMLGVVLGKACITKNVPVTYVAKYTGLSRMTIYSWFKGHTRVPLKHAHMVHELLDYVNNL